MNEVNEVEVRRGIDAKAWGLRLGIRAVGERDGVPAVLLGVRDPEAAEPEALTLRVGEQAEVAGRTLAVRAITADSVLVELVG